MLSIVWWMIWKIMVSGTAWKEASMNGQIRQMGGEQAKRHQASES